MSPAVLEKPARSSRAKRSALSPKDGKPRTVQMNVRVDADTKKRGDRAFERIGMSPSEAVRSLWGYADRHANNPEALRQLIAELEEAPRETPELAIAAQRASLAEEGRALVENFRAENHLSSAIPDDDDDERLTYYEELREEAYRERLVERGL